VTEDATTYPANELLLAAAKNRPVQPVTEDQEAWFQQLDALSDGWDDAAFLPTIDGQPAHWRPRPTSAHPIECAAPAATARRSQPFKPAILHTNNASGLAAECAQPMSGTRPVVEFRWSCVCAMLKRWHWMFVRHRKRRSR
jgi:hypothetical protein